MSTFAWLDHSEEHRKRMLEVIGLFKEKGTVDELGIGSVRDAISEVLFPGTSTLHTRARYLLFLPWICRLIEAEQVPSRQAGERLRQDEVRLIEALVAGGEREGVIGIAARANLKRFPSDVYWSQLERYGIRRTPASKTQYLRTLDGYYARLKGVHRDDDGNPIGEGSPRNWQANLPSAPEALLDATSFELTVEEADYLSERIVSECGGSYLAHLTATGGGDHDADFPWGDPAVESATPTVRDEVEHARVFSEVMHGALLLYNLILADLVWKERSAGGEFEVDEDLTETYRIELEDWAEMMHARSAAHEEWERARFWQMVSHQNNRVPSLTVGFIDQWMALAMADPGGIAESDDARRLITSREAAVKRSLARVHNLRALERWSGASGTAQLNFRWGSARQLVADIRSASEVGGEAIHARA